MTYFTILLSVIVTVQLFNFGLSKFKKSRSMTLSESLSLGIVMGGITTGVFGTLEFINSLLFGVI